jgi:hypothetical protein
VLEKIEPDSDAFCKVMVYLVPDSSFTILAGSPNAGFTESDTPTSYRCSVINCTGLLEVNDITPVYTISPFEGRIIIIWPGIPKVELVEAIVPCCTIIVPERSRLVVDVPFIIPAPGVSNAKALLGKIKEEANATENILRNRILFNFDINIKITKINYLLDMQFCLFGE